MENNIVENAKRQIRELNKEMQSLRNKRAEYEKIIDDEERKAKRINHDSFIGKCFINKKLPFNKNKHIVAFQILEIEGYPREDYAKCLTLVDGTESSIWHKYGVIKTTVGLWTHNQSSMVSRDDDPLVIDMFEEISWEKFYELAHKHFEELMEIIK